MVRWRFHDAVDGFLDAMDVSYRCGDRSLEAVIWWSWLPF